MEDKNIKRYFIMAGICVLFAWLLTLLLLMLDSNERNAYFRRLRLDNYSCGKATGIYVCIGKGQCK